MNANFAGKLKVMLNLEFKYHHHYEKSRLERKLPNIDLQILLASDFKQLFGLGWRQVLVWLCVICSLTPMQTEHSKSHVKSLKCYACFQCCIFPKYDPPQKKRGFPGDAQPTASLQRLFC